MAELTIEQQRALAIARARLRAQQQGNQTWGPEAGGVNPMAAQTPPEQPDRQRTPGAIPAFLRGAASGATLGFSDEFMAGVKYALGLSPDFQAELANQRGGLQRAQQEHPTAYTAGNVTGAVGGALLAAPTAPGRIALGLGGRSLGQAVARQGAAGAGLGAVAGAGNVDGGNMAEGAVEGAKWGGLGGLGAGAIGHAVGQGVGAVRNWLQPSTRAEAEFGALAGRDSLNVDDFRNAPPETMAMDAGQNLQAAGRGAASRPGPAQDVMRQALSDRAGDIGSLRVHASLEADQMFGQALSNAKAVDTFPALAKVDQQITDLITRQGGPTPTTKVLQEFRDRIAQTDDPNLLHEIQSEMRERASNLLRSANDWEKDEGRALMEFRMGLVGQIDQAAAGAYRPVQDAYAALMARIENLADGNPSLRAINAGLTQSAGREGRRATNIRDIAKPSLALTIPGAGLALGGAGFPQGYWAAGGALGLAGLKMGGQAVGRARDNVEVLNLARLLTAKPSDADRIGVALSGGRQQQVSAQSLAIARALMGSANAGATPMLTAR
jgi:hypothetical protein